jgi:motility quorum-sensing regulator / GCU-specific mRNA interferase toxin
MEKQRPHYKLAVVKALIEAGSVRTTVVAAQGAADLGIFGHTAIYGVVLNLARSEFYKSMTSYRDHREWQDVYHTKSPVDGRLVYVKFSIETNDDGDRTLILSFKEK